MLLSAVVLWPFPVFQILHVESSAVVATVAWFCAGLSATKSPSLHRLKRVVAAHIGLLLLPLVALTASVIWAPNCAYATGLAFFTLFTLPSVVLAAAVGVAVRTAGHRAPRTLFVLVSLVVIVGGVVYDLWLHPQFFTYSHVFGGVLGPIYDEDIAVRPGIVWFRVLTFLWATALVGASVSVRLRRVARARQGFSRSRVRAQWVVATSAIGIGLIYGFSAPLGINSPEWFIRHELGALSSSERFDLYHSLELSGERADALLGLYEYHFDRLHGVLGVAPTSRVKIYAYPDPFTRERLTGARYTNVAPVWLPTPQVHVLADVPERVHAHELVHVFSREFGLPFINASPSIGLIEGLAVALERPYGGPSPDDQVAAMLNDPRFDVTAVASRMTPTGFWGARGAVSYTTAGSFVSFLISEYPVEYFTSAYGSGRFRRHYGKSIPALATEWEAGLRSRTVTSAFASRTAVQRFSIPSLFEVRCPHYTPPHRRHLQAAQRALIAGDSTRAIESAQRSLAARSDYLSAGVLLADLHLQRGEYDEAIRTLRSLPETPQRNLRLGDAHALLGDIPGAREAYVRAADGWPASALDQRALTLVRLAIASDAGSVQQLYKSGERATIPLVDSREGRIHAGLIAVRADRLEDAVELLSAEDSTAEDATGPLDRLDEERWLLDRLRLRLLVQASIESGRGDRAVQAAREGRDVAMSMGDVDSAAFFAHAMERGRWLEAHRTRHSDADGAAVRSLVPGPVTAE